MFRCVANFNGTINDTEKCVTLTPMSRFCCCCCCCCCCCDSVANEKGRILDITTTESKENVQNCNFGGHISRNRASVFSLMLSNAGKEIVSKDEPVAGACFIPDDGSNPEDDEDERALENEDTDPLLAVDEEFLSVSPAEAEICWFSWFPIDDGNTNLFLQESFPIVLRFASSIVGDVDVDVDVGDPEEEDGAYLCENAVDTWSCRNG
eukprot:ANDGO_04874.mRNA.1 hypothetical protein